MVIETLITLSLQASAVVSPQDAPGLVDSVTLNVVDEVSGDCFTNESAIISRVSYLLETADIPIYDGEVESCTFARPCFSVHLRGNRADGGMCLVVADFAIYFFSIMDISEDDQLLSYSYYEVRSAASVDWNNANLNLMSSAEQVAQDFASSVVRGRRQLSEDE